LLLAAATRPVAEDERRMLGLSCRVLFGAAIFTSYFSNHTRLGDILMEVALMYHTKVVSLLV
jgi:hypothetical protein